MAGHSDDRPPTVMPDIAGQTEPEKIAQAIVPYARDDARARYLGLRSSGFTIRETLRLMKYSHSALSVWRDDKDFVALEERIPEFRKQLSNEYVGIEFTRNYRLVLEKDYRVLQQSLYPEKDGEGVAVPMSDQDHEYLKKMRSHYTPQSLQILEALMNEESKNGFDFTSFVMEASRIQERITITAKKDNA